MLTAGNWPREACAQGTDELASLRTQVSQLYNQGKYAEAAPIAERYADLARQKHGDTHTEYATAIAWLADVYQGQRRYAEAEPLYRRALAARERTLGAEHPDVVQSSTTLPRSIAGLVRN
jgi:tetratricopeptide (TPR) repeat protein